MPVLDRDKLAKVLAMLGSHHDGEVAAAGRSAHILLTDAGVTWTEVLTPPDGADPFDRDKLAKAEAENWRLVIELAQRRLGIDNLIAKLQQEIRKLQRRKPFASIKTLIGWAAMGLAVSFIGPMIWSVQSTHETQVLRGAGAADSILTTVRRYLSSTTPP